MTHIAATEWVVFTKPWPRLEPRALAGLVLKMGFTAVEFPLRPGFQVDMGDLDSSMDQVVAALTSEGVSIASVATEPTPANIAACARNGVGLVRVMSPMSPGGYRLNRGLLLRFLDQALPVCEEHGVRLGIQPHYDHYVSDSRELSAVLDEVNSPTLCGIWDAAHDGLSRKSALDAIPLLGDRLAMANFKNACYRPEPSSVPPWDIEFVSARAGLASWPDGVEALEAIEFRGPLCLPAEYTDERDLVQKVSDDLTYLKGLVEGVSKS